MSSMSDKLGSLSKEHGRTDTKKEKESEKENEPKADAHEIHGGSQLFQRCVIIQRDERGYGLTVSGDNPVFVQSVKENGAAARAGVLQGDRIIKVNGSLVTNHNHREVVKLIRSGSYVALTLLGRAPPSHGVSKQPLEAAGQSPIITSPSSDRITAPLPVNSQKDQEMKNHKLLTIRMMYDQALQHYEKTKKEFNRNSSEKLHNQLTESERTLKTLEAQLGALSGSTMEHREPMTMATYGVSPLSSPAAKSGSGDSLDEYEDSPEQAPFDSYSHPPDNPAPWLPGGPRHRKADSMPESFCDLDELTAGSRDITVGRSHSDSRKRGVVSSPEISLLEGASAEEPEKHRTVSVPEGTLVVDVSPADSPLPSPTPTHPKNTVSEAGMSDTNEDVVMEAVPEPSPPKHSSLSSSPSTDPRPLCLNPPAQVNIISMEEEEFSTDDEHLMEQPIAMPAIQVVTARAHLAELDDHGAFSDLTCLKTKPAHLAVFLHYLISNSDPAPLFFYLVSEPYAQGNMKEMRKWAYEIFSTFLVEGAPLRVNVEDSIISNINNILVYKADKEDILRSAFVTARLYAEREISELLADFRNKRALGLGGFYGDTELQDNMDRQSELRLVESCLAPHFEHLMSETEDSDRNRAVSSALATFIKQFGVTFSKSNALERCQSFVAKDKKMFKFGSKSNRKIHYTREHHFMVQHYYVVTYCSHCQGLLWGIGNQGYQCMNCEANVHKGCLERIREKCPGQLHKKRKDKRTSMLDKIITRKPSSNNPAAIREAQRLQTDDSPSPSHISTSVLHIRAAQRDDEDEEIEDIKKSSRVGKLVERYQDLSKSPAEEATSPVTPPRSQSPDTLDTDDQKKGSNLNRSESLNRGRKTSAKPVRRTRSDVAMDENMFKVITQSGMGSSSNSSLSTSLDSPNDSTEDVYRQQQEDSDLEAETELPSLDTYIPKDVLKKLKPKEKKRQEVINELFHTERAHVRVLKVMYRVFYMTMQRQSCIPPELVRQLFPNLEEMIRMHSTLNYSMKVKRKENPVIGDVADILLERLDSEAGEKFRSACATFCRNQSYTLEHLKNRQRKDPRLLAFIQEAQNNPLCRRLELKDLLPMQWQRLTKYPLLIESLLKYTGVGTAEHEKLERANESARNILSYVDQAVKECENQHKLADLHRRMDKRPIENSNNKVLSEYRNLDLTRHKMLYDGQLVWRIGRKHVEVHAVLLEDILVLLQKADDRLVLKCQSTTVVAGKEDTKFTHSPIIKMTNLLTRNVAVDKKAFFLVSTSEVGPQIYELAAFSSEERKKWFKYITDAAEAHKGRERSHHRRNAKVATVSQETVVTPAGQDDDSQHTPLDKERKSSKDDEPLEAAHLYEHQKSPSVDSLETFEKVEVLHTNQPELIQPTEVVVADTRFEQAEPVLTPLESLKRKDELIERTMEEKQRIVAHILQFPPEEFVNMAEIADESDGDKEPRELVLASILQTNRLLTLVNSSLNVITSEADTAGAKDATPEGAVAQESITEETEEGAAASADVSKEEARQPELEVKLPSNKVSSIANKLNQHLSMLLDVIWQRDQEKERLQQDLRTVQERLLLMQESPMRSPSNSVSRHSRPESFVSIASSVSEGGEVTEDGQPMASSSEESAIFSSPSRSLTSSQPPGDATVMSDVTVTGEDMPTQPQTEDVIDGLLHESEAGPVTEHWESLTRQDSSPTTEEEGFVDAVDSETNLEVAQERVETVEVEEVGSYDAETTNPHSPNTVAGATF